MESFGLAVRSSSPDWMMGEGLLVCLAWAPPLSLVLCSPVLGVDTALTSTGLLAALDPDLGDTELAAARSLASLWRYGLKETLSPSAELPPPAGISSFLDSSLAFSLSVFDKIFEGPLSTPI